MTRAALRHTTVSRRRRGTTTTRRRRSRRCRNDVVVRHVAAAATTTSCVAVVTADGVLSLFDGVLVLDLRLLQTTQPRHLSAAQRQLSNDTLVVGYNYFLHGWLIKRPIEYHIDATVQDTDQLSLTNASRRTCRLTPSAINSRRSLVDNASR